MTNIGSDAAITAGTIQRWRSRISRAMREIEDGEADDRERQRRDQPVEDSSTGPMTGTTASRSEQRAAVGGRRRDQRERHQRRRRAVRAERDQHARAGEERRHLRQRPEMLPEPRAPRRIVHRPDRRLLDRRRARVTPSAPVTSSVSVSPGAICCTSRQTRSTSAASCGRPAVETDARRGPRDAADAIAVADAGAIGGAAGQHAQHRHAACRRRRCNLEGE